jgi:hypothetical protein
MPTPKWRHDVNNQLNVLTLHEDANVRATGDELVRLLAQLDCDTCYGETYITGGHYVQGLDGSEWVDDVGPCPTCGGT